MLRPPSSVIESPPIARSRLLLLVLVVLLAALLLVLLGLGLGGEAGLLLGRELLLHALGVVGERVRLGLLGLLGALLRALLGEHLELLEGEAAGLAVHLRLGRLAVVELVHGRRRELVDDRLARDLVHQAVDALVDGVGHDTCLGEAPLELVEHRLPLLSLLLGDRQLLLFEALRFGGLRGLLGDLLGGLHHRDLEDPEEIAPEDVALDPAHDLLRGAGLARVVEAVDLRQQLIGRVLVGLELALVRVELLHVPRVLRGLGGLARVHDRRDLAEEPVAEGRDVLPVHEQECREDDLELLRDRRGDGLGVHVLLVALRRGGLRGLVLLLLGRRLQLLRGRGGGRGLDEGEDVRGRRLGLGGLRALHALEQLLDLVRTLLDLPFRLATDEVDLVELGGRGVALGAEGLNHLFDLLAGGGRQFGALRGFGGHRTLHSVEQGRP